MRAVVVLLLLIANAIVSTSSFNPPEPAPPARTDYSLGLLTIVDGGTLSPSCSRRPVGDAPDCTRSITESASHSEAATAARL